MPKGYIKRQPRDYFGNVIEIGDAYFYGSPPCAGKVIAIKGSSIILQYKRHPLIYDELLNKYVMDTLSKVETMTCKSTERGVCLDKTIDKEIV